MVSPLAGASWHRLSRGRQARLAGDGLGDPAGYQVAPDEFRNWAAGTGLALVELASQLTRASVTRSRQAYGRPRDKGQAAGDAEDTVRSG